MKPWCGVFRSPEHVTMWGTVLFASRHHPEEGVRAASTREFDRLIADPAVEGAIGPIQEAVLAERGTPLEPFLLAEGDADTAARVGAIALARMEQSRFRIVSRDTLTAGGGLVLTQALKHYFSERYLHGKTRQTPKEAGFFAPGDEPDVEAVSRALAPVTDVSIEPDDEGLALRITVRPDAPMSPTELFGKPGSCAIFLGAKKQRRRLRGQDAVVAFEADAIVIRPGSPEGLMRLSAASAGHATLLIGGATDAAVLAIRLSPVADEPTLTPFACAVHVNPFAAWLTLANWDPPALKPDIEDAIGRWLAPKNDWDAVRTEP